MMCLYILISKLLTLITVYFINIHTMYLIVSIIVYVFRIVVTVPHFPLAILLI